MNLKVALIAGVVLGSSIGIESAILYQDWLAGSWCPNAAPKGYDGPKPAGDLLSCFSSNYAAKLVFSCGSNTFAVFAANLSEYHCYNIGSALCVGQLKREWPSLIGDPEKGVLACYSNATAWNEKKWSWQG